MIQTCKGEVSPAEGIPLQLLTCLWGVRGAVEEFPLGPGDALGMGRALLGVRPGVALQRREW